MNKVNICCPNCGSTAQTKKLHSWETTSNRGYTESYICGCGCRFAAIYKLVSIKKVGEK